MLRWLVRASVAGSANSEVKSICCLLEVENVQDNLNVQTKDIVVNLNS